MITFNNKVQGEIINGEAFFLASDVFEALGIKYNHGTINRLKELYKHGVALSKVMTVDKNGVKKPRKVNFINHKVALHLVTHSKKEEAQKLVKEMVEIADEVRRTGKYQTAEYKKVRTKSKEIRRSYTDSLKEHGVTAPVHYARLTNKTKMDMGIDKSIKKNDMSTNQLKRVSASEALQDLLHDENDSFGFSDCWRDADQAKTAINQLTGQQNQQLKEA